MSFILIVTHTAFGPYKCMDLQFDHSARTCSFRNLATKQRETISIEDIDFIAVQQQEISTTTGL